MIHRTIILPVVLYGCDTWSLISRDEHTLKVLRKMFGSMREEVTRESRRLHNEELYNLYSSPNIIRLITSRRIKLKLNRGVQSAERRRHSSLFQDWHSSK
jgi:hypothetical protein